jgi:hypothetical protein
MGKRFGILPGGLVAGLVGLLVLGVVSACSPETGATPETTVGRQILPEGTPVLPEAHAIMMGDADLRLAPPVLSNPPAQLELGQYHYWMSCMVCHGDRGQGLTVEWRSVLDPADQNCWQSKCHAANHPPEGFEIPREAPLLMGTGAMSGYKTIGELHAYLSETMPWSFPGLLPEDAYWQLSAYLAEANRIELPPEPLGPGSGDDYLLVSDLVQTHHTEVKRERAVTGVALVLLFGALILRRWSKPLAPRAGSPIVEEERR